MLDKKSKKGKRHWFIVRNVGDTEIRCLLSAFSAGHIERKIDLKNPKVKIIIQKAKRWHIAKVFSGLPVFYDYKTAYGPEGVESLVSNDFYMELDGAKILIKILS